MKANYLGAPQRREARRLRRAARYSEPVQRTRGGAGLRAERGLALSEPYAFPRRSCPSPGALNHSLSPLD